MLVRRGWLTNIVKSQATTPVTIIHSDNLMFWLSVKRSWIPCRPGMQKWIFAAVAAVTECLIVEWARCPGTDFEAPKSLDLHQHSKVRGLTSAFISLKTCQCISQRSWLDIWAFWHKWMPDPTVCSWPTSLASRKLLYLESLSTQNEETNVASKNIDPLQHWDAG